MSRSYRKNRNINARKRLRKSRRKRIRKMSGGEHANTKHPPYSINKHISHVLYINLDSRNDRRRDIEKHTTNGQKSKHMNTTLITRTSFVIGTELQENEIPNS